MRSSWLGDLFGLALWLGVAVSVCGLLWIGLMDKKSPADAIAERQQAERQQKVQRWSVCWGTPGTSDAGASYTLCAIVAPTDPNKGFTLHNPSTGCFIEISPVTETP